MVFHYIFPKVIVIVFHYKKNVVTNTLVKSKSTSPVSGSVNDYVSMRRRNNCKTFTIFFCCIQWLNVDWFQLNRWLVVTIIRTKFTLINCWHWKGMIYKVCNGRQWNKPYNSVAKGIYLSWYHKPIKYAGRIWIKEV